ncbi:MAG: S-layer homology domain-containing protein [Patescibacteria group bacterium]
MKTSRSVRRRMPPFRADRLIVGGSLLLLAVAGIAAALQGTALRGQLRLAQNSDPVSMCYAGCESMQGTEEQKTQCRNGCSSMTTTSATGGGCSGAQPNWPDCAMIECQNNNWTCTQMRSGSAYSAPSGGFQGMSCEDGCRSMTGRTQQEIDTCVSGCGSYPGGTTYSSGYTGGGWSSMGTTSGGGYTPPSGSTGGGWDTGGRTPYQMCLEGCGSDANCVSQWCAPMAQGSSPASSAGGYQGGYSSNGYPSAGGMRNCTYPHAFFSTDYREFSAFCESDYVNCKRLDTNAPLSTQGLSLGAPSSCESGWSTGGSTSPTGGYQGGYTSGPVSCTYPNGVTLYCESPHVRCRRSQNDTTYLTDQQVGANGSTANCVPVTGGGTTGYQGESWSSLQSGNGSSAGSACERQCDQMPVMQPLCQPGDTAPLCASSINECKQRCVNGSPTGGYGGGYQQQPQRCQIDPCNGQPLCMAPVMEGGGGDPQCVGNSQCRPIGSGAGGGGGIGTDIEGARRDAERNLSDYDRQLGDMSRAVQESRANVGSFVAEFKAAVARARSCVGGAATSEAIKNCVNYESLGALSQKAWDAIQAAGAGRQIEEAGKQLAQMRDYIERMKAYGNKDMGPFESLLKELTIIVSNAKADPKEASSVMQRFYDRQGEFWKLAEASQGEERNMSMGRGLAEGCGRIQDEGRRRGADVAARLDGVVQECLDAVARLTASGTVEEWQVRQAMDPIWKKFETEMQSAWGSQACRDAEKGAAEARRALTQFVPQAIAKAEARNPALAAKLELLQQQGLDTLALAEGALQANRCNDALKTMSMMEDLGGQFDRTAAEGGMDIKNEEAEAGFVDHTDDYADIYRSVYEGEDGEEGNEESGADYDVFTRKMEKQGYRTQEFALLKKMDPKLIREYLSSLENPQDHDVVRAASVADLSTTSVEALMATRIALTGEIEELRQQHKALKAGIQVILEKIKAYTFNAGLAKEVSALVTNVPGMNAAAIDGEFKELVAKSKDLNVEQGITPFTDVDPFEKNHEWFFGSVKEMTERGIFKGVDGKNFAPEKTTNVAETLVVAARLADLDTAFAEPSSAFARSMPAWAQMAAAALEDEDVDLEGIFAGRRASDPATRLQIARVLAETMDLRESENSTDALRGFRDGGSVPAAARDEMAAVVEAGIMRGSNGTLDPNGSLTRGMFATLAARTVEATDTAEGGASGVDEESGWTSTGGADASASVPSATRQTSAASSSSAAPAAQSSLDLNAVKASDHRIIQALVSQWVLTHKKDPRIGLGLEVQRLLQRIYDTNFGLGRDTTYVTLDLELQLLEEPFKALEAIVAEMEQSAAQ